MTKDIFVWAMTAYEARTGLNAFRKEIKDHITSQQPLPLNLITGLLPINAENISSFLNRGPLKITGTTFQNIAASDLRLIIDDNVLKTYTIVIPENWRGTVTLPVTGNIIKIQFDPPIQMDVPRIEELGISRSEYQALDQIESDLRVVLSHLVDTNSPDLETIVQVEYNPNAVRELPPYGAGATKLTVLDSSGWCGFGQSTNPGSPQPTPASDWYVFRHAIDGAAVLHEGATMIAGYQRLYGPDTYDGCSNWVNTNCPDEICPAPRIGH
jgi:hypothetical protein